jgi:hypothetical protein
MKKLILLGIFSVFALGSFAQNSIVTMVGSDTIVNTANDTVYQNVLGTYETVALQAVVTKLSGTVTTTFAYIQGSIDGTNYVNLNTDTLTCTQQTTNTKVWVIENSNYTWLRIIFDGGGTQSSIVHGYLIGNPPGGKHSAISMVSDINLTSDTATNTGTAYLEKRVKGWYNTVSIQAVATKLTGTAGGTITLQGSVDGTNFVTVSTKYLADVSLQKPYTVDGGATLTVLDQATTTKIFTVIGSPYSTYRLSYTGTGTMTVRLRGYLLGNKK